MILKKMLEFVESMAEQEWNIVNSKGLLAKIGNLIGLIKPVDLILIKQYEDADWNSCRCTGNPIRFWTFDENGLVEKDNINGIQIEKNEQEEISSLSFHIHEEKAILVASRVGRPPASFFLKYESEEWKTNS